MFEKYTTEELTNSLKTLKGLASETGDVFYFNMIVEVVAELNKRGVRPN